MDKERLLETAKTILENRQVDRIGTEAVTEGFVAKFNSVDELVKFLKK